MHQRGITRCLGRWTPHPDSTSEGALACANIAPNAAAELQLYPDKHTANARLTDAAIPKHATNVFRSLSPRHAVSEYAAVPASVGDASSTTGGLSGATTATAAPAA